MSQREGFTNLTKTELICATIVATVIAIGLSVAICMEVVYNAEYRMKRLDYWTESEKPHGR